MLIANVFLACALLPVLWAFPSYDDDSPVPSGGRLITFPPPVKGTNATKHIPDAAHPWRAPKAGDLRGPCPGLNTLANHGYLPRSGVMTFAQLIDGAQEGFNLDYNFTLAVASFGMLARGNAFLDLISIGGESSQIPPLPGNIDGTPGGLAKHGRFEGDVSLTREDAAIGDNVNFQPDMFANLLSFARRYGEGDIVTADVFHEYRKARFQDSLTRDHNLTYHTGRNGFSYGESGFVLKLFANSKTGNLTVSDMTSFFQNETFPPDWYRFPRPFTFADIGDASNLVKGSDPAPPGADDASGQYIVDTDPRLQGRCGLYYNLAGQNVAGVLLNTTGLLRKNVDTLVDGIFQLFQPSNCTRVEPFGPAKV